MIYAPDEIAEIRRLTTYHLAHQWLLGIANEDGTLPLTKRIRLAVVTVVDEMRHSVETRIDRRVHLTTATAIDDPNLTRSMHVALLDLGATVDHMATSRLDGSVLACNLAEDRARERSRPAATTKTY